MEKKSGQLFRIETKSLVLRPFEFGDAAAVHRLSNERSSRQWLPSQVCADEAEAREVLRGLIGQYAAPADPRHGAYVMALDHRGDGVLIGHVGLSPFEGDVEIRFAVAEAYQRQGLALEAVVAACGWAFGRFGLPGILAITARSNEGSRKVLARAGFEHRGDRAIRFQGIDQTVSVYYLRGPGAPPPDAEWAAEQSDATGGSGVSCPTRSSGAHLPGSQLSGRASAICSEAIK